MYKEPLLNYLEGKIKELQMLDKYIDSEITKNIINAKLETLLEIKDQVVNAAIPFDMI